MQFLSAGGGTGKYECFRIGDCYHATARTAACFERLPEDGLFVFRQFFILLVIQPDKSKKRKNLFANSKKSRTFASRLLSQNDKRLIHS